jgi:hypothetical protein
MAQQTAVEWAMSQIIRGHFIGFAEEFQIIYDKAKAMEKEQIIEAAADHCYPTYELAKIDAEEYYDKTFKLEVK